MQSNFIEPAPVESRYQQAPCYVVDSPTEAVHSVNLVPAIKAGKRLYPDSAFQLWKKYPIHADVVYYSLGSHHSDSSISDIVLNVHESEMAITPPSPTETYDDILKRYAQK